MKHSRFFGIGIFSLLIFLVGCVAQGPGLAGAASAPTVPDFHLKDLSQTDVDLAGVLKKNKVVLLNFWATWCPPCREEIPDLIRLQEQHQKDGFTVLGVDVGESHTKVSAFAAKIGINYPVLLDADMSVAVQYKIVGIPTSLLVGSDGKIRSAYHAVTPELAADIENALK